MDKGVVIQVYGDCFAGCMHMLTERWYKINYDLADEPLKITGVSPFSIMGRPDPQLQKYASCKRTNTRVKADIRKDFDTICEESYCDYFVFDNSPALMGLVKINGQLYTYVGGEETDFSDDYLNERYALQGNYINPLDEICFDKTLKPQYDLFIDAVLRHYPPERVILIRSHIPYFRLHKGKIVKTRHTKQARALLKKLDNYFAERVNCPCLRTAESFFEEEPNRPNRMFERPREDLRIALERAVISEIEKPQAKRGYTACETQTPAVTVIAEYITDGGCDLNTVADYFKHAQTDYTFDDIAALFYLYEKSNDKSAFTDIARVILQKTDGAARLATKELFERNINRLRDYEYCMIQDTDKYRFDGRIIVAVGNKYFLEISQAGLNRFDTTPKRQWDYNKFIEDGYVCDITNIDAALESWETYFERGRRKCAHLPFILQFENTGDFEHSLYFLDYEDILDNEHYVIALPAPPRRDSDIANIQYQPKVDAGFLFDEKTRVLHLFNGLSDHMEMYITYKKMADEHGFNLFLDNTANYPCFNGIEIEMVTSCDITPFLFSNIFSKRLLLRKLNTPYDKEDALRGVEKWAALGLKEAYLIINTNSSDKMTCGLLQYLPILSVFSFGPQKAIGFAINKPPAMTPVIIHHVSKMYMPPKNIWETYFTFPCELNSNDIIQNQNIKTAERMRRQDAISIHIRRGDHITTGLSPYATGCDFYKPAIELVWANDEFKKYENKHLYVFSDDIKYVKQHYIEYGFDIVGSEITYVNWNHHYNSMYDMYLLSLSKVIIRSVGGFSHTAALISRNVEYVIYTYPNFCGIEWKRQAI